MARRGGPLAPRNGVNASRIRMPRSGSWATIWEFLSERYGLGDSDLRRRAEAGDLRLENGTVVGESVSYRPGAAVFLRRDVPDEPESLSSGPSVALPLLHRDARLVAVDKPPGIVTAPGAGQVAGSVVVRLRRELGLPQLTPVHRLDRLTAGVLLLTTHREYRRAYQGLFARREVSKVYHALAGVRPGLSLPVTMHNRVVKRPGRLQAEVVPGPPNATTVVERIDGPGPTARYRLVPRTGRTHQLRVHMSHLGIPILGDPLYPVVQPWAEWEGAHLCLLAHSVSLDDPFTGETRRIVSRREVAPAADTSEAAITGRR